MSLDWLNDLLQERRNNGLSRSTLVAKHLDATTIEIDGQRLVNFGANDYMGLACHPDLLAAAFSEPAFSEPGASTIGSPSENSITPAMRWGSGASPLVSGYGPDHAALEAELAKFETTEAAIIFSSGFAANVGTVAALASGRDIIFSDALNHASLIDGCRLSRAKICVYPHADIDLLRVLIRQHRGTAERAFIVTDSLFSMDGDIAPLQAIVELAEEFEMVTIVDEAHATGIYGDNGLGVCESLDLLTRVPVRIGTLSKALGGLGGFVVGSHVLIEYLRNFARPYIYSTAMPSGMARASRAALKLVHSMTEQRRLLKQKSLTLREGIHQLGFEVGSGDSPIIPIYLGDAKEVVRYSQELRRHGHFVPAIRPPTVPLDRSLLRISLSVKHTDDQLRALLKSIGTLLEK
ncbi:MAG: 8-amino-7-oxononanoate synthase [Pirellulaceae bacterium]|nr:8-amino-7-oxononanoate synthase [Pirellulaceae bacterium]